MTTKKDEKQDGQSIDELFNTAQPKVKVDPNTGLIEQVFEDDEVNLNKQIWEKNPRRSQAMAGRWSRSSACVRLHRARFLAT